MEPRPQAGTYGCGTVLRLTKSATGSDGNFPVASVIFDRDGNLYGTTEFGGIQNQDGYGTIFKPTPEDGMNRAQSLL